MKNAKIKTLTVILFAALIVCTLCLAACGGNRGHKVEFEVNGGTALAPMYSLDEIDLPDAKREGYTFNGWYKEIDAQGNVAGDRVGSHYTVTGPVKLYADWLPFTLSEVYDGYELTKAVAGLTELEVPSEFNGSKITSVGANAFSGCSDIVKVTLPSSVNRIGASAFKFCVKLGQIEIGGDVTEIKDSAFEGCAALGAIDISNVTAIGASAFKGCANLQTLTACNNVDVAADSFEGCTKLIAEVGGVKYINNCAVGVNSDVTAVTLTQGTVAVWGHAFAGSKITQVDLSGVEYLGDFAFSNCTELNAVTLGTAVKSIGNNAFYGCEKLSGVTLPSTVQNIGVAAFYGCKQIASITLPSAITEIKANTFSGCANLASINLDNCTYLGVSAFEGCKLLSGVNLERVVSIGAYAFKGCSAITSVTLTNLQNLHTEAFAGTGLTDVELPRAMSIPNGAFDGCENLSEVGFLALATSIGENAFRGCKLTSVTLGEFLTYIGVNAFGGCEIAEVYYSGELTDWVGIEFASNPVAIAHNLQVNGTPVTDIVLFSNVDKTVSKINANAFDGLGNINTLVLDRTITEIGNNAFRGCTVANVYYKGDTYGWSSLKKGEGNVFDEDKVKAYGGLTEITIPSGVTSIYAYAFEGCTSLNTVVIPDSVTTIGNYAFSGCSSLKNVTMHAGITSIGNNAFAGCYMLESINLSAALTSIGNRAFVNCPSLKTIVYAGTREQWNILTKDYDWDLGTGNYVVKCSDGDENKSQDQNN